MKIVHYCLGIPPFATGGLTIYANSLAKIQAQNNDVYIIYPGLNKNKIHLKKMNNKNNINIYSMDGALPVALTYGVKEPLDFIGKKEKEEIELAFDIFKDVDILHLHTIQGIYPEILEFFKDNGAKIIFTTHDFYPFSLTTKYYFDENENIKNNIIQSIKAPSTKSLYLNRRPLINKLKKLKFIKKIFNHKVKEAKNINYDLNYEKEYMIKADRLYSYYKDMFKLIDVVHANSNLSKSIYDSIHDNVIVLPITHDKIKHNPIIKIKSSQLNIGFFGEQIKEKGFNLLLDVLDDIYKENSNFNLKCFGHSNLYQRPYLSYYGSYKQDDLASIHRNLDFVIFPAENAESFGFVVLEALAYDTPVIVSKNVGSKDLCNQEFIFNTREELKDLILKCLKNQAIFDRYFSYNFKIQTIDEHNQKILDLIYN